MTQHPIYYLLEAQNRTLGLYETIDLARAAAEQAYQKSLAGWGLRAEKYTVKVVRPNASPERLSLTVLELSPSKTDAQTLCEAL